MQDADCAIFPYAGKVATAEQMRDFDRRAVDEFGVPGIVLMENAGRHVAQTVQDLLGSVAGKRVTVVAGRGNNGGDGFVAARHLRDAGADVATFLLADQDEVKGDAKIHLDILLKSRQPVKSNPSVSHMESALIHSDVIVDAIFGTGLHDEIKGPAADAIRAINTSHRPVVAVDIPSGVDANTGHIWGVCVKADYTVTFALPKIGLYEYPGAAYVGEVIVGDIGIPSQLYDEINIELSNDKWIADRLPRRFPDAHKGTFGTALVIAGSSGFTGAAAMASEAALRAGAGLSVVAVPQSLQDIMAIKLSEVMTRGLPETDARSVSAQALDLALDQSTKATALVLGCGLGTHPDTCEFVQRFVQRLAKPMVVDADGLNCLAENIKVLEGTHDELIITPHPGEMARLLVTNTGAIQSNRMAVAREAASRFHCIVVLKGARTLIAEPNGRVFINPTGNVGMATGGTGDVLAGTIGGFLAQGMSPLDAAVCGTYVHGKAGDIAAAKLGTAGMIAGDLLRTLPKALKELYALQCED